MKPDTIDIPILLMKIEFMFKGEKMCYRSKTAAKTKAAKHRTVTDLLDNDKDENSYEFHNIRIIALEYYVYLFENYFACNYQDSSNGVHT
jgi:uncharacterized protein YkuJ